MNQTMRTFKQLTTLMGVGCLVYATVACGAEEDAVNSSEVLSSVEQGQVYYERYCALCHGDDGEGYKSPAANALSNQDFLVAATDDFLSEAVRRGRTGTKMSPFGAAMDGPIDDAELVDLVAYIRSWQEEESADIHQMQIEGDPSRAMPVYEAQCASCHGDAGEGTTIAVSLSNPVFLETVSDGFLYYALVEGRRDTVMSSYKDTLDDQTLRDLVALMRSWQ